MGRDEREADVETDEVRDAPRPPRECVANRVERRLERLLSSSANVSREEEGDPPLAGAEVTGEATVLSEVTPLPGPE